MVEPPVASKVSQQSCVTKSSDSSSHGSAKLSKLEASFHCLADKLKEVYCSKSLAESKSVPELVQIAVDKARMTTTTQFSELGPGKGFRCDLSLDFVLVSSGEAQNKRLAKHTAFVSAAELLRMPCLQVTEDSASNFKLVTSRDQFARGKPLPQQCGANSKNTTGLQSKDSSVSRSVNQDPVHSRDHNQVKLGAKRLSGALCSTSLNDFVLLQPSTTEANAVNILQQSADFNKWPLEYSVTDVDGRCRCHVTLGGHTLGDVIGDSKSSAKTAAAEQLLKRLKSTCCTVCIKKLGDEDLEDTLKRTEVMQI